MARHEEMWQTAERKRMENVTATEGMKAANRSRDEVKAAVNLHVAKSLLAGLSDDDAIAAAVAAGHDERDAENCQAIDDARDREMLEWYVERGGRA